ncbi:protein TonB [Humitalea rosea]|uniref:Protein TonB n=2 Tax=Humitalea rosea TaxID=990373 RepID=A0A2W7JU70_9PROT|nr:protein TonB [Humitalea rosea]
MAGAVLAAALLHLGAVGVVLAWPEARRLPEPQQGAVLIWAEPASAAAGAEATPPSPEAPAPESPAPESPAPESPAPEPPAPPAPEPAPSPPEPAPAPSPEPPPPPPPAPPAPSRPPSRAAAPPRAVPAPAAPAAAPGPPAQQPAWAAEGATTPPAPLAGHRNADPTYPNYARTMRQQGSVRLRLTVAADGLVAGAAVDRGSGYSTLDAAAVEAALRWRFRPAQRDGQPVTAEAFTTVTFRLDAGRQGF